MGTGGASGVVDATTNPQDVYAVQLFAGQSVTLRVSPSSGSDFGTHWVWCYLFAPGLSTIQDQQPLVTKLGDDSTSYVDVTYLPATTDVYYLAIESFDQYSHGAGYNVSVLGSEGMPSNSTVWSASISPGFSASPVLGRPTWVHGRLTPNFNANAPLLASSVQFQESTDTVHWTTDQTLARDGVFDVSVTPTGERWFRFYYAGDDGYAGNTSASVHVTPLTPTSTSAHASVARVKSRRAFTIAGHVSPGEGGDSVSVYVKKPGHGWSRLTTTRMNGGGDFSVRTSFKPKGTYAFYVTFFGSSDLAKSTSGKFTVKVK
jgi:hypothetical protein